MAAIDHTQIVFKNGKWMKETFTYDEGDNYVDLVPFKYTRDGAIYSYSTDDDYVYFVDKIEWYHDEYDAVYERDGIKNVYNKWGLWDIVNWIKWKLRWMKLIDYEVEIGTYKDDNVEVYIYRDPFKQSYVSFYRDKTDTYVVLGGYGRHNNVYCHFMGRGYGDEFEEKMAVEALEWCLREPLKSVVEALYQGVWEREDHLRALKLVFSGKGFVAVVGG